MEKEVSGWIVLKEEDRKFIEDKKNFIIISGAQILSDKVQIEELTKEIRETDKKLRLLL